MGLLWCCFTARLQGSCDQSAAGKLIMHCCAKKMGVVEISDCDIHPSKSLDVDAVDVYQMLWVRSVGRQSPSRS